MDNFFNFSNVVLATCVVAMLVLGFFVLVKDKNNIINRLFFGLIISAVLWVASNLMANISVLTDEAHLLWWTRFSIMGPVFFLTVLVYFAIYFPFKNIDRLSILLSSLKYVFIIFAAMIIPLVFTKYNVSSVTVQDKDTLQSSFAPGILYYLLIIYSLITMGLAVIILLRKYRVTLKTRYRSQIKNVLLGLIGLVISALVMSAILPIMGYLYFINIAPVSVFFLIGFTTYAILKHQLFDIRVIFRKIVLYSALLAIVFGVYTSIVLVLTSYIPIGETASNFLAAALIAFGFEPLRQWLQNTTEKYLFVKEYNSEVEIGKLTETLNNVVDLDEALRQMMQSVTQALKLDRAAILVLEKDEGDENEYAIHLDTNQNTSPKDGLKVKRVQEINFPAPKRLMDTDSKIIINYLRHKAELIMVDDLEDEVAERKLTNKQLSKIIDQDRHQNLVVRHQEAGTMEKLVTYLKNLKVSVVVPIMIKQKLIGALYLGEKLSNDSFYEDDLNYLSIVGAQTASAIEKARFYEEDQLKSEFVSIASHELLTPTAAIEGYLSMILEEKMAKVDAKAEDYLWKVYTSAQRLSKLVKDLLSVSRIEAGRIKIKPKVFDLKEVVQQQIDQLMVRAKEAGLKLNYKQPAGQIRVFADPERVAQAVVNLVGNSLKYTKQGSIDVSIVEGKKYNEVQVKDTGIGIKEEDREHLFEKFHRVDSKDTAGIIGTGLGLYITKSIIELMGGKIWVKSTIGKGSTFGFSIRKHKSV